MHRLGFGREAAVGLMQHEGRRDPEWRPAPFDAPQQDPHGIAVVARLDGSHHQGAEPPDASLEQGLESLRPMDDDETPFGRQQRQHGPYPIAVAPRGQDMGRGPSCIGRSPNLAGQVEGWIADHKRGAFEREVGGSRERLVEQVRLYHPHPAVEPVARTILARQRRSHSVRFEQGPRRAGAAKRHSQSRGPDPGADIDEAITLQDAGRCSQQNRVGAGPMARGSLNQRQSAA